MSFGVRGVGQCILHIQFVQVLGRGKGLWLHSHWAMRFSASQILIHFAELMQMSVH